MPAIIDWSLHRLRIYEGTNILRVVTGLLIGLTFATLLYTFLETPFDINFWSVSMIYILTVSIIFNFSKRPKGALREKSL